MKKDLAVIALLALLSCNAMLGQSSSATSRGAENLEKWRKARSSALMNDFGELSRYREANARIGAPSPGESRVVFFGDSITEMWDVAKYFPQKPYYNRGISGQTTLQMLIRFRQDVIQLQPKVVVVLAGTNDIAGNTGPMSLSDIEANLATIADLARTNGIRVVFSSILPVHNYTERSIGFFETRPTAKIEELNTWLKQYCAKNGHIYLDYSTPMSDSKGLLKRELADDGLHPNEAGYKLMTPLAEAAIREALRASNTSASQ